MRLTLSFFHYLLPCLQFVFILFFVDIAVAQPVVNLGPDIGACDSYVLDAGNSGATYLWNTNEVTQTISVTASGTYWVDVTDGTGMSRDSIEVEIVASPSIPSVPSTDICGPGDVSLSTSSAADEILWYEDSSSTIPMAFGNNISLPIPATTTLYVEANNYAPEDTVGLSDFAGATQFFVIGSRGITFDVFSPSVLKSIKLITDQPGSIRIQLENSSGAILDSVTIHISASGQTETNVPLYFDLPVGTDFRLMGENVTGGFGMLFSAAPYPFDIPGIISLAASDINTTTRYSYFFDWIVTQQRCSSPKTPVTVTVLPAPIVDLGQDTALCGGSLVLDVSNPGASYLWSTNDTGPSIVVSSTNVVSVAATIGSCTVSDTISVEVLASPAPIQISDTSICGTALVSLTASSTADEILWYDDSLATIPIVAGQMLNYPILSNTTLYVESNNYASIDTVGLSDFGSASQFFVIGTRGVTFDVFSPSVLKSVKLITNQPGSMRIQLEDNSGAILDSVTIQISATGQTETTIPLYFDLPAGTGFRLMGDNVTGGFGMLFSAAPYPFDIPGIISLTASDINTTTRYSYFFDWAITRKRCSSPKSAVDITVLSAPIIDLGPDTALCGGSLLLDVSNANASYLWSTGSTDSSIVVSATDIVSVEATIGSCTSRDTIAVDILSTPTAPLLSDTSICGSNLIALTASSNSAEVLWYEDPTDLIPFASGHTITYPVSASTTIYAEANTYSTIDTVGLSDFGSASQFFVTGYRGVSFDVLTSAVLKSVKLLTDQPGSMRIQLEDNSGAILDSVTVTISETGAAETTVPLFFDLPVGTGFRLMGENVTGGFGMLFSAAPYPFDIPEVISLTGSDFNSVDRYSYFFDWAVTRKVCNSPLSPLTITVLDAPDFDLGFDRAVCGLSFTLDASSPGSTYLWSTGAQTPSITINQTDTFSVVASIGSCVVEDTVYIELVEEPLMPIAADTTVCGNGEVAFTTNSEADAFLWYAELGSENVLSDQDSFFQFIQDTTTFYVEAVNYSTINHVGVLNFSSPQAAFQPSIRGISFDVFQPLTIKSVTIYADQFSEATILLEDEFGNPLDSVRVSLEPTIANRIPLYFDLAEGQDYKLLAKDIVGGSLAFYFNNLNYPYTIPNQISLKGSLNGATSSYYYFFDWEVVQKTCISARTPVTVTVALPLNLGEDLYSCDPVILDSGTPSASHLWNTGDVSQNISVDQSGLYWVEISDMTGCVSVDTIEITIPELSLGEDGKICGTTLISGYDSTSVFMWNTGATTPDLPLTNTGTYWLTVDEPLGCTLTDTIVVTGFADFPIVDLGMDFSECDSAILDAGTDGISYLWSTGDTTQTISIQSAGVYEVSVSNEFDCTTTDEINVFIALSPVAEFNPITNGLTVFFENLSSLGSNFWDFGDGNTSNLSSPTHTYQDTGMYTVRLILVDILNNCGSDTFYTTVHVMSTTSIDVLANGGTIEAYPNPTQHALFVRLEQVVSGEVQMILSDIQGKQLVRKEILLTDSEHVEVLSIPKTSPGLYILKVQTQAGYTLHKVMIH